MALKTPRLLFPPVKPSPSLKTISISTRITLFNSLLYLLIAVASFVIIIYSTDTFLAEHKHKDLAEKTILALKNINRSPNLSLTHSDYYFYIASNRRHDPLKRQNIENTLQSPFSDAKFIISDDGVLLRTEEAEYRLKWHDNLDENTKSSRLGSTPYYYLCVPFIYDKQPYVLISIFDSTKDNKFKRELIELLFFAITVSIGILVIFSRIVARTSLSPLSDLASQAKSIDFLHAEKRLNIPNSEDEIKILAESLNQMLDNIESLYKKTKQFTQDASHELRIPLTVILGNIEIMEQFQDDEEIRKESLEAIKTEALRVKEMIERLLMITRLESDHYQIKNEDISIHELLTEIAKDMGRFYGRMILVKAQPVTFMTDKSLLTQLIRALVENAIKYSEQEVLLHAEMKEDRTLNITVTDYGQGISQSDLEHLRNRFYRTDASRNSKTGGIGLGLSIAESISEALDCKMFIESEPGKGTTVSLLFDPDPLPEE